MARDQHGTGGDAVPDVSARLAALGLAGGPLPEAAGLWSRRDAEPEDAVPTAAPFDPVDPVDPVGPAAAARRQVGRDATREEVRRPAGPSSSWRAAVHDRLPPWLQGASVSPSGAGLLALTVVCLVCVAATGFVLLHRSTPTSSVLPPLPVPSAAVPLASATPSPAGLVVDVGGRVRRPGLVTLPPGSRVADAIDAAGGALRRRDLLLVNLAAPVTDGQLLLIGVDGAPAAAPPAASGGAAPGPVDLNAATLEQLDGLPGIGPVLAQRILDWRDAHGGFGAVVDLQQVSGIGDATYAELAPLVTV